MENKELDELLERLPSELLEATKSTIEAEQNFKLQKLDLERMRDKEYLTQKALNSKLTVRELECLSNEAVYILEKEALQAETIYKGALALSESKRNELTATQSRIKLRVAEIEGNIF